MRCALAQRSAYDPLHRGGDALATYTSASGDTTILVADASAKGRIGETHADALRSGFLASAPLGATPRDILRQLNRTFFGVTCEDTEITFASAFIARVTHGRSITYACAGHDSALLFRGRDHEHLSPTGPILGIRPEVTYEERTLRLNRNDVVVVPTDGVTESCNAFAHARQFGTTGIARAMRDADLRDGCSVAEHILRACDAFCSKRYRDDASIAILGNDVAGARAL